ncbi:MAG: hypothetical protein IJ407_01695 [Clostridia bacterium]|nr:hypothetical protein [Clostridia bacterium]MBQ8600081.1 hypothetical protein [Clostridia bacterium]
MSGALAALGGSDAIGNLLGSLGGMDGLRSLLGSDKKDDSNPLSALGDIDPAFLLKAGKALSGLNNKPDDRCLLLAALKPYLRKERRERVDEAIRILKLMRVAELFRKDLF